MVPGILAVLYGKNLTTNVTGIAQASGTPWPTQLRGTSVIISRVVAPLYAIANLNGQEQINFQVPWETSGANATVVISNKDRIIPLSGSLYHVASELAKDAGLGLRVSTNGRAAPADVFA